MLVKRYPKDGEILKINPEFIEKVIPKIIENELVYAEIWKDKNHKYLIKRYSFFSRFQVIPIGNEDKTVNVDYTDTGLYDNISFNIPMFITLDNISYNSSYCECGSTSYTTQIMFSSIIKICQSCGKDKKENDTIY